MLSQERSLERSPDALYRIVDGEAVILHAETGVYFSLNRIGSRIWALLNGGRTAAALCDQLVEEFEVSRDVLARDISAFLDDLEEAQLVRRAS